MYIGNSPADGENNSFKILDNISTFTQTFDGSSSAVVSTSNSTLTFTGHRFITGQRVTYSTTGTTIGGLTSGTVYYIIKTDPNIIQLASSYANAVASTYITLTGLGVGTTHTLNVAFDGVNTRFKATYDNGTKAQITRAAQLQISVNGVIQQPQDTVTPTNGFGIGGDSVIVFSTAPTVSDVFWGNLFANNFPTFDISDNTVDTFTGTGSQTDFVLSKVPANNQNVLVTIDGVVQYPSDATNARSYSVIENVLSFVGAPGNGTTIQVRHIGFAGATSSAVTGFYGRTGNVGLTTADVVNIGAATIGVGAAGTTLLVRGNARITGILTIGTGSITLDGTTNTISGIDQTSVNNSTFLGIATFANGPVIIGTSSSTGTASQVLQATGGAYVSGNLGIGSNAPGYKLDVLTSSYPTSKFKGTYTTNSKQYTAIVIGDIGANQSASIGYVYDTLTPSNSFFNITPYGASEGSSFVVNTSGNVGIGLTNPSYKLGANLTSLTNTYNGINLQYNSTATSLGLFFAGSSYTYGAVANSDAWLYSSTQSLVIMADGASSTIKFASGGNGEKARIDSSGNLGIGVIPSAWVDDKAFQIMYGAISSGYEYGVSIAANAYRSTSNVWKYLNGQPAFRVNINNVGFQWFTSPSGTTNNAITFTQAMTLNTSGDLGIINGNLVIGTSGKGIDFSATANSSGTMTSELLADYEEGTFTPSLTFGGGSTGIVHSIQSGNYVKIGTMVFVRVGVLITNKGSSTGVARITGLPFTIKTLSYGDATGACGYGGMTGLTGSLCLSGENNNNIIYILQGATTSALTISDSVFTNSAYIFGTFCYNVA